MRSMFLRALAIASPALLLVACSGGEPSASDIKAAYSKAVDNVMNEVKANAGGNQAILGMYASKTPTVESVEKLGDCNQNDPASYTCSVKVTVKVMGAVRSKTDSLTLFRTSDGWELKV